MRMKYEIEGVTTDSDGADTWLPVIVGHTPGESTVQLKVGRGTEVLVAIDPLMAILGKVDEERRAG